MVYNIKHQFPISNLHQQNMMCQNIFVPIEIVMKELITLYTLLWRISGYVSLGFHNSKIACELRTENHLGNGSTLFQLACQQSNKLKWFPFQSVYGWSCKQWIVVKWMFIMLSLSIWMHLKCRSIRILAQRTQQQFEILYSFQQRAKCIDCILRSTTECSHIRKVIANSCQTNEWTWPTFELLWI